MQNFTKFFLVTIFSILFFISNSFSEMVNKVKVVGNDRISLESILVFGDIKMGDDYNAEDVNLLIKKLNKLSFQKVNFNRFPSVKLIEKSSKYGLLTPTIINASNEVLVDLFLSKKIGFLDIVNTINKIFKDKDFRKYARRVPTTIKDIKIADNWARLKTKSICVR